MCIGTENRILYLQYRGNGITCNFYGKGEWPKMVALGAVDWGHGKQ